MPSELARYFSTVRRSKGIGLGQLARLCGYRNVSKGASRLDRFEKRNEIHETLLAKLADVLGIDHETVARLIEQDRQQYVAAWTEWANTPIQPSLILGHIGGFCWGDPARHVQPGISRGDYYVRYFVQKVANLYGYVSHGHAAKLLANLILLSLIYPLNRNRPVESIQVSIFGKTCNLGISQFHDHPIPISAFGNVHREEPALHGGSNLRELIDRRFHASVVALLPILGPEDGLAVQEESRNSLVKGIPLLECWVSGSKSINSRKTKPSFRSSSTSSIKRRTTRSTALRSDADGM